MHTPRPSRAPLVAAIFSLGHPAPARSRPIHLEQLRRTAAHLHHHLPESSIALITGPSGSGKSTILNHLASLAPRAIRFPPQPPPRALDRAVIDTLRGPLPHDLSLLAHAGLADAHLYTSRVRTLSESQRWRLSLALSLDRAARRARADQPASPRAPHAASTLLIDEFASTLDRVAAAHLAVTLSRWLSRQPRVRAVIATAHDDIAHTLAPRLHVTLSFAAPPSIVAPVSRPVRSARPLSPHEERASSGPPTTTSSTHHPHQHEIPTTL